MYQKLEAMGENVLIEPLELKLTENIIIPDSVAKTNKNSMSYIGRGRVISLGDGFPAVSSFVRFSNLKEGDIIWYVKDNLLELPNRLLLANLRQIIAREVD